MALMSNSNTKSSQNKKVIRISKSSIPARQDYLLVGFNTYCGYSKKDLRSIVGGFYVTYNYNRYLFIIGNRTDIPPNTYIQTGNTIDVEKYMGVINEGDFNLYIKNSNNQLSLVSVNCDGE